MSVDTKKSYFEKVDAQIKDIKELASSYYLFRAVYSLLSFLLAVFNEVFAWYYLLPVVTVGSGFKAWVNISEARASDSMNNNLWQKSILNSFLFLGGIVTIILLAATAYVALRLLPVILTGAYVAKFFFKTAQVLLYSWRYFRAAPGSERKKECLGRIKRYGFSALSSLTAAVTTALITICDVISGGTSLFLLLGAALVVNVSNTVYVAKNDLMKKSDEMSDILKNLKHVKDNSIKKKLLSSLIKSKISSLNKEVDYYKKLEESHAKETTSYSAKLWHKVNYWISSPASWASFETKEKKDQYFNELNNKIEKPSQSFLDNVKKEFYKLKRILFSNSRTIEERQAYLDELKVNADKPVTNLLTYLSQVPSNIKLVLSVVFNYKSIKEEKVNFLQKLQRSVDMDTDMTEDISTKVKTGETEALLKAVELIDQKQSSSSHYDDSLLTTLKSLDDKEDRKNFLVSIITEKINNTTKSARQSFLETLLQEVNEPEQLNLVEYLEIQKKVISEQNIFSPSRTSSIQILFEAVVTHKYLIERNEGIADFHKPGCQRGYFYFTELHKSIDSIENPEKRTKFILQLLQNKITSLQDSESNTNKHKAFALTWLKKWIESNLAETPFCTPYTKKTKNIANMEDWIEHFNLDKTFKKEVLSAPSEGKAGETKALIVAVEKYLKKKDTLIYHKKLKENTEKKSCQFELIKDPEERKQLMLKLLEDKILNLAPSVKVPDIKSIQKTFVLVWLKKWIESNLAETPFCTPYTKKTKNIANMEDWFAHFKQDKKFAAEVESAYFADETSETVKLINTVQKYLKIKEPYQVKSCCSIAELPFLEKNDQTYAQDEMKAIGVPKNC